MRESMTSRVGRLISGGFNALIDAVENVAPETVMEEAVREIDGAIDDVRAELGRVIGNKHLANTRLREEHLQYETLAENIALAVTEQRDDLAEAAIAKQLDIEVQIPILEATVTECGNLEKELESYIVALQAKKREMQDELRLYSESRVETDIAVASGAGAGVRKQAGVSAKVEKAGSAFERVMEKATGIAAGQRGVDGKTAAKVAELEQMAHSNRIAERLAAIKTKLRE